MNTAVSTQRMIRLTPQGGTGNGWRASLPLRVDWEETHIVVDATEISFVVPTFMLRLRCFVDWYRHLGKQVTVLGPRSPDSATYLSRMQVAADLPAGTFRDLPVVNARERDDVLIPVTRLQEATDVDVLAQKLNTLLLGHSDDVAVFASAMHMALTEFCGNAMDHGANHLGCYVAAQRYERPERRTVLALGDVGIGIPAHLRRKHRGSDHELLRRVLETGFTGTDENHRGWGYYWVIDRAQKSRMRYARLEVRSQNADLIYKILRDKRPVIHAREAGFKRGTWICFELGPLD